MKSNDCDCARKSHPPSRTSHWNMQGNTVDKSDKYSPNHRFVANSKVLRIEQRTATKISLNCTKYKVSSFDHHGYHIPETFLAILSTRTNKSLNGRVRASQASKYQRIFKYSLFFLILFIPSRSSFFKLFGH